jgi:TfoX/Sxy family transcriptional regulator of competence genes
MFDRKGKKEGRLRTVKKYNIKRGRIKTKRMFAEYILVYQKGKKIIIIRAVVRGAKNGL